MVIGGNLVPITGGKWHSGFFEGSSLLAWPLEMALQGKVHSEAHLQGRSSTLRLSGGRKREGEKMTGKS